MAEPHRDQYNRSDVHVLPTKLVTKQSSVAAILAQVTPQNVTVGAGGAVIALSEVDDEYEEMLLKATSVLGALGHKKHPGRGGPAGSEPTRSATTSSSSSESKKKRVPAARRK